MLELWTILCICAFSSFVHLCINFVVVGFVPKMQNICDWNQSQTQSSFRTNHTNSTPLHTNPKVDHKLEKKRSSKTISAGQRRCMNFWMDDMSRCLG